MSRKKDQGEISTNEPLPGTGVNVLADPHGVPAVPTAEGNGSAPEASRPAQRKRRKASDQSNRPQYLVVLLSPEMRYERIVHVAKSFKGAERDLERFGHLMGVTKTNHVILKAKQAG